VGEKHDSPKSGGKPKGESRGVPVERRTLRDRRQDYRRYAVRRLDEQRVSGIGEIIDERRFVERRRADRRKGLSNRRR
jgi:hypothetical protein